MSRCTTRRAALGLAVMAAVALTACGPDRNDGMGAVAGNIKEVPNNKISADVREYEIHATDQVAVAGDVTFTVTNYGTMQHEFLVIRTDYPVGQIPVEGEKFNEESAGVTNVGETGEFDPGLTKTVTVKLAKGRYQLVCNIPGHYKKGMSIPFEVV